MPRPKPASPARHELPAIDDAALTAARGADRLLAAAREIGSERWSAFLAPLPEWLRPLLGALLVGTAATGTMVVQHEWVSLPPIGPIGLVTGTLLLAALWIAAVLGVRTQAFARWARPH